MSQQRETVYLRRNVLVEPLFNQWYAWSYLIPPATAAMYVANLHLKIMESFIVSPQVHAAALKNPANLGGPFLNYEAGRVGDVRALRDKTVRESAPLLALADAIRALDRTLAEEADGNSLEPLYAKVPDALKGYVELVYDRNNHASARFIEGLLYRSTFYNPSAQSLTLRLAEKDERSFVFSTPRLADDGGITLNVPFNHPGIDELFRMKSEPRPFGHIREALGVAAGDEAVFAGLFTAEPPPPPAPRFDGGGVRIRYFGHACILIESAKTSVLCDPVISYPSADGIPRYTFDDLPERIDYVLLTHNHQDHCMFETLLQLRHKIGTVVVPKNSGELVDPSLKLILQTVGFPRVIEIDEMETVAVEGGGVTGLPFLGEHADLNIRTKIAYLVNLEGRTVVCAADSNNIEPRLYAHIQNFIGQTDVVFIGMECEGAPLSWLYGPLLTRPLSRKMDQSRRFDGSTCEKAIDIVERLKPGQVYVYAMGQEPWLTYLTSIQYTDESRPIVESNKLIEACSCRGLVGERLFGQKEILLTAV